MGPIDRYSPPVATVRKPGKGLINYISHSIHCFFSIELVEMDINTSLPNGSVYPMNLNNHDY